MQEINVAGIKMAYEDRGRGPVLLLVHGVALDHPMWQHQIDDLSSQWRVIAPDLRGFGRSGVTAGEVSMEQFADDLAELITALAIDKPLVLCGLSMGGYVAWQFVRKYRERLRGLILCDTKASADTEAAAANRRKMAAEVTERGTKFVAESLLPKLFAPYTTEHNPEAVDYADQAILATDPRAIAAAQLGMANRPDVTAELADIDLPTLLVAGQFDEISPVDEMREIEAALPQAELVIVPAAGHMAPLENPEVVNAALREYLAKLP